MGLGLGLGLGLGFGFGSGSVVMKRGSVALPPQGEGVAALQLHVHVGGRIGPPSHLGHVQRRVAKPLLERRGVDGAVTLLEGAP